MSDYTSLIEKWIQDYYAPSNDQTVNVNIYGSANYISFKDPLGGVTRCNSFVTLLLDKAFDWNPNNKGSLAYPFAYYFESSSNSLFTGMFPSASQFHDNIYNSPLTSNSITTSSSAGNNKKMFNQIKDLTQIKRGDILGILFPTGYNAFNDTGHVMIARGSLIQLVNPIPPILKGTTQYQLRIIDSTANTHYCGGEPNHTPSFLSKGGIGTIAYDPLIIDARYSSLTSKSGTGIGAGCIKIYLNSSDSSMVGYTWSMLNNSTYHPQVQDVNKINDLSNINSLGQHLAVGRINYATLQYDGYFYSNSSLRLESSSQMMLILISLCIIFAFLWN